jgi:hypothetical protein
MEAAPVRNFTILLANMAIAYVEGELHRLCRSANLSGFSVPGAT